MGVYDYTYRVSYRLDPGLKKNAFINIFTEVNSAHAYIERKSTDLTRDGKKRFHNASDTAIIPEKHQKLAWDRGENKFYQFVATPRVGFRFGSKYIWDYCDKIKADAGAVSANNKFIDSFL